MDVAVKGQKRKAFISDILSLLRDIPTFNEDDGKVSRKDLSEGAIQYTVFNTLNNKLPDLLSKHYDYSNEFAKDIVKDKFRYEKKEGTVLHNFKFFNTNHRADATLEINDLRIAFEIKKVKSGSSIRSGIGQSLVYATQYDFVLYFLLDISKDRDIRDVQGSKKVDLLKESLWDNYNIKLLVV